MRGVLPVLLILLLGCSDTGLREAPPPLWYGETDTWFQEREDYADILLVVDNSGSMGDEQDELSSSFEAFVEFIERAETHYHIGVVTTDVDAEFAEYGEVPGQLRGQPHFITPDTEDAAAVFRDAVRVGVHGSGYERGFEAARAAWGRSCWRRTTRASTGTRPCSRSSSCPTRTTRASTGRAPTCSTSGT